MVIATSLAIMQAGCSSKKPPTDLNAQQSLAQNQVGESSKPRKGSRVDQILKTAEAEWDYFGRQTVLIENDKESMPLVGKWEDDGDIWASRVNTYWRSVGKPRLDGYDCKQPWSAAFISYVMQNAGLSVAEFPPADAHWSYIRYFAQKTNATSTFRTHKIGEYAPRPGDLICATRGNAGFTPVYDELDTNSVLMGHTKLHCDLVTSVHGNMVEAIGGNVRNSVSKTTLITKPDGKLQPSERRPWFVVMENQLGR